MPNKHIQIQLLHITYFYNLSLQVEYVLLAMCIWDNNKIVKNPILMQYIVLFPLEAWSHVKQHHQEEITQYIAYTMPKQNLNWYNNKNSEESNFPAIYCVQTIICALRMYPPHTHCTCTPPALLIFLKTPSSLYWWKPTSENSLMKIISIYIYLNLK